MRCTGGTEESALPSSPLSYQETGERAGTIHPPPSLLIPTNSNANTPLTIECDGCAVQGVLRDGYQDTIIAVPDERIQAQAHCRTGTICNEDVLHTQSMRWAVQHRQYNTKGRCKATSPMKMCCTRSTSDGQYNTGGTKTTQVRQRYMALQAEAPQQHAEAPHATCSSPLH